MVKEKHKYLFVITHSENKLSLSSYCVLTIGNMISAQ